jgi:hypothetical protein
LSAALTHAARAAGPPLLFWAAALGLGCLALYVAFWLGSTILLGRNLGGDYCVLPQRGFAAQGWYRMIGTSIGAVAIVVLTAWFPQARALSRRWRCGARMLSSPRFCTTSRPTRRR